MRWKLLCACSASLGILAVLYLSIRGRPHHWHGYGKNAGPAAKLAPKAIGANRPHSNQPPASMSASSQTPTSAEEQRRNLWADNAWYMARCQEAYVRTETKYGRFLQSLKDWPKDRVDRLKMRLTLNDLNIMETAMLSPPSPQGVPSSDDSVSKAIKANENALEQEFGAPTAADIEAFNVQEGNRPAVAAIVNGMRAMTEPVSADLEETILSEYSEASTEAAKANESVDVSGMTPEQFKQTNQEQRQVFYATLQRHLASKLSSGQMDALLQMVVETDGQSPSPDGASQ